MTGVIVLANSVAAQAPPPGGDGGTPPPRYPLTIPDTYWRLRPDFTGSSAYSYFSVPTVGGEPGGSGVRSVAWEPLTFGYTLGSYSVAFAHDTRGDWQYAELDGYVNSGGSINYNLEWIGGPAPANFRSFFTLGVSASASTTGTYGSTSAATDPSQTSSSSSMFSSSSARRVYELTGTQSNLSVSLNGTASTPKNHGTSGGTLVQLSSGVRWHPHPSFTISGAEPGNQSRSGPNTRDGRQDGMLDIAASWYGSSTSGSWISTREYGFSQDLYSTPLYRVTGGANTIEGSSSSGVIEFQIGDGAGTELSQTSNLSSKIFDQVDSQNPVVEMTTSIRWHKPLERPVLVPGSVLEPIYEAVAAGNVTGILATGSPTSTNVGFTFTRPGSNYTLDPAVATALEAAGIIIGTGPSPYHKAIGAALALAGLTADKFGPKPEGPLSIPATTIFACKWPNETYMGSGIDPTRPADEHWIVSMDWVMIPFKAATYNCELYGLSGYLGQGNFRTFEEKSAWKYQGTFRPETSGPPGPPSGGGA